MIFSQSVACLFILFIVSFAMQKFLSRSHLFIFVFISIILGKRYCCDLYQRGFFLFSFSAYVLRGNIWKATKEKQQITYKGISISLSPDYSAVDLQARREWHDIFKMLKRKIYNQEYSTQQGSHSDSTEKTNALQAKKC